ncbi:hypothetical protein Vretimale_5654 [Volvox reticuliferus]|uniref:Uncharacterized protein n=1 Tax=Volvox reticuliferus TaxID=1737510 RepID=A0A8J4CBT4_9CHLO|nr:hypothetical protein Vretifemale_5631 [Volvox reticuliferus]GIM00703.1 hypothetical protein Vretimale_5654 [Volvox reticuliferus]
MPGKPVKKEGLFDDGSLLGFLQATLEAMEAAAGGQLTEERAKLQELQMALGGLGITPPKPETDDLALANQVDKLEQQLEAVESQISAADDNTKQLLTQSTAVWAGLQQDSDPTGTAASSDGGAALSEAMAAGDARVDRAMRSACATSFEQGITSGLLLPVAEQAEDEYKE